MPVAALITDFLFVAKVKGTADALGVPLIIVRSAAALVQAVEGGVDLAIVDMNAAGADPAQAIRSCKTAAVPPRVIAFLSHVQTDLADAAASAGADRVMPRSKFSQELASILKDHADR